MFSFFSFYWFMFLSLVFLFLLCFMLSFYFYHFSKIIFLNWNLFSLYGLNFNYPFYFDFMSLSFMGLVLMISSMILLYSSSYMVHDMYPIRFIMVLLLFVLSMILFILSPNFISMILGWDGLGLVSYCLVIHYQNFKSNSSGMLTALSNRVGDCFLIVCICYSISFHSWNYMITLMKLDYLLVFFVVLCSITKSAQIPFSSWLPAAMAAPTPVSSLVHSSTLVTAGVYFLIRFSNHLFSMKFVLMFIVGLGLMTTLMAGLSANVEVDMKKVIALSTLSQLGLMMSTLYLNRGEMVYFHLFMHALFKALMFMCSGIFIHLNFNTQDIRFYGILSNMNILSIILFSFSNLCLCGMPFLCGFYSKDLILELLIIEKSSLSIFLFFLFGVSLTVFYSVRSLMYLMNFGFKFFSNILIYDSNKVLSFSLLLLFFSSIIGGSFFSEFYLVPLNLIILPFSMKILVLFICLLSCLLSLTFLVIYKYYIFSSSKFYLLLDFFFSMFFFSYMSKKFFVFPLLKLSKFSTTIFSHGWIEYFYGSNLIFYMTSFISLLLKNNYMILVNNILIFCFCLMMTVVFCF